MLNYQQLVNLKLIPATHYKYGRAIPNTFNRPTEVSNETFKKLPLYIQVGYVTEMENGFHKLKGSK